MALTPPELTDDIRAFLKTPEAREGIVRRTSTIVALTLLSLVILQFVGPYIAAVF